MVDHDVTRIPDDAPARLPHPQAEVDVLRAIEDALVEEADRVERAAPDRLAGADHVADVYCLLSVAHVIVREAGSEPCRRPARDRRQDGREGPRGPLPLAAGSAGT